MNRQKWTILISAAGMMLLILDSRTALSGAKEGIEICIRTLIPSLFPFFVLSCLMTGNLAGISFRWMKYPEKWFRIPSGSGHLLLLGFLAGYPVGAKNVADAYRKGQLSSTDGQRMTAICNNAGPAFLFGVLSSQFGSMTVIWLLWFLQILSSFLIARLTAKNQNASVPFSPAEPISPTQALDQAIRAMALVCGWVILFRILSGFLDCWCANLISSEVRVIITGLLELSNGCLILQGLSSEGLRFTICAGLISFGGFCVLLQTGSVCRGFSMKEYFRLKIIQSLICYSLALLFQFLFIPSDGITHPLFLLPPLLLLLILIQRPKMRKKSSSIPATFGV